MRSLLVVSPLRRGQMFLRPLRKRCRELMKSSAVDKICPSVRLSVVVMSSRRCTCLSSASSRWLENLSLVLLLLFNAPWNKTLCVQDSRVFFLFYISHKSHLKVEDASLPAGLHVYVRCNNLKSYTRYSCGRDGIRSVKGASLSGQSHFFLSSPLRHLGSSPLKTWGEKKLQAACSFGGDLGVKFAAQDSFTTARTASEFC